MRKSTAILLAFLVACSGAPPADAEPVVRTDHGGYRTYQGIPYAAPPERWKPPAPAQPWRATRDATKPAPPCAQANLDGSPGMRWAEDCLYLNVTQPVGPSKNRPVMVWLHGGGFTYGSSNDYDGRLLATRGDVVVVTVNYRLGIFGFLDHAGLGAENGNFGFADQAAALRWVRTNAAAFGGDPGNVTLFGESAGAMSVCSHLTSPAARGLFDKAIIESGSCMTSYPKNGVAPGVPAYRPWQPARRTEDAIAGCTRIDCLRAKPVEQLATTDLMSRFSFPVYGTSRLPEDPEVALRAGRFHRVPVLQGSNRDEMRLYVGAHAVTLAKYDELLTDSFGAAAARRIRAAYPPEPTPALAWAAVLTDAGWSCTTLDADRALARRTPTYAYEFADAGAPNFQRIPTVGGFPLGAAHGAEMAYLFPLATLSAEQQRLSDTMVDAWTRFARDGDPGWGKFPQVRTLGSDDAVDHHCELWS